MEVVIDLEEEKSVQQVVVGTLENQGSGIYFPIAVDVYTSNDGKSFKKQGDVKRAHQPSGDSELKDFKVSFDAVNAKFVKVKVTNLKKTPAGGNTWLFVDEVLVD